jgi:putative serine protease PepD
VVGVVALVVGGLVGRAITQSSDGGACVATDVVGTALPSVVTVETATGQGGGNGSGQVIRPDGYILTNYHVVSSAAAAADGAVAVRYADGSRIPAAIVGLDPTTDLAVIKAEDGAAGRPVIALGSSTDLRVGQPVVALGAPRGLTSTATAGIVSALDRYLPLPLGDGRTAHLIDAVQTDASINPGNSGGALVDCAGRLVGVNSAIITVPNAEGVGGGGSVGLGFAIPVDLADAVAEQLIATGHANHPTFGLQAEPLVGPDGRSTALLVTGIDPGGPAEAAGLQVGDTLTAVDSQTATNVSQLEKLALVHGVGDSIHVSYTRNGTPGETAIVLGSPGL